MQILSQFALVRNSCLLNKWLIVGGAFVLLAACGSQENAVSEKNIAIAVDNNALTAANNIAAEQANSQSQLLTSLAASYPNGQLPPERAVQAANDLANNPAALKLTAATSRITAQSLSIQAQATSADYAPVQRIQNTTLYGAYFFSIYPGEVTTALATNPNWALEGPAFWASLATGTDLHPVHRFQNKLNGSYLYTIYDSERANIVANYAATFAYEGVAWNARQTTASGWSALYRFRNKTNGTYLFSAFESEKDAIVANYPTVFELEGIAYYVRQDAPPAALTCTPAAQSTAGYSLVFKGCNGTVALYYDVNECVRENATGLIWQGQTPAGTGLRANDRVFTNLDNTTDTQNYNSNNPIVATQAQIDAGSNSVGFKNAVNASSLCGKTAWRLPKRGELFGIVDASRSSPAIDTVWFPSTASADYWTSTPYTPALFTPTVPDPARPWLANKIDFSFAGNNNINFSDYRVGGNASSALIRVRLVHDPEPLACLPIAATSNGYSLITKSCNGTVPVFYDKTECVKDNTSGLIWEGKPTTGPRAANTYQTNFDSTTVDQVANSGSNGSIPSRPATLAEIAAPNNTVGYAKTVNASSLCGSRAWRLPTRDELATLVKSTEYPYINNFWFPNTKAWGYWTSTPAVNLTVFAKTINFAALSIEDQLREDGYYVRLVRN